MSKLKMDISFVTWIDDDPIAIRFIPSGWCNPRMYHALKEYGDYEDTQYLGLFDRDQIRENFLVDIPEEFDLSSIIKNNPNDYELGTKLRKIHNQIERNESK